jgi:hypothetical protein
MRCESHPDALRFVRLALRPFDIRIAHVIRESFSRLGGLTVRVRRCTAPEIFPHTQQAEYTQQAMAMHVARRRGQRRLGEKKRKP